jgi:hypothetical protein
VTTFFLVFTLLLLLLLVAAYFWNRRLEAQIVERDGVIAAQDEQFAAEKARIQSEAEAAVAKAQHLVEQQRAEIAKEFERVRDHFETESRRVQTDAESHISKLQSDLQLLRKYEGIKDAESETHRLLNEALGEATALRSEARTLLEKAKAAAADEKAAAVEKVRDIHEQADARLNQALRDAGRIVAEAEKRAAKIAGEAYTALRDKELLEQAAEAMKNRIEGYGDKYLIPTHSLLDDLATEYGYDAAGQSLSSAREQSRRMVEQGEAATCDYVEAHRRTQAIQFVIHAFNGSVDAILTRTKTDNYGVLEQKIRDCFSIVNRDGSAFRNARILPAYLDARLAELKWAVVVQELAQRDREEQRYLREQERDRQKAEEERERQLRDAEKEKQVIKNAMEAAELRIKEATAEQKTQYEKELQEWRQKFEDATKKELTIAQQTSKGRIYVISNVGSFGDGVYKIGLTRRAAEERVDELSNASVPFEFDIHAVIETDNAPALEWKIHQQFLSVRMNKINLRKEFFRVTLDQIKLEINKLEAGKDFTGTVVWTERAKAQQFYESLGIDRDAEAKQKWLDASRRRIERRERSLFRLNAPSTVANKADQNSNIPMLSNGNAENVQQSHTAQNITNGN